MNDYAIRINRVIDYIEKNLDKNLSLDELSSIAHFSKYHFHRIFSSLTGERHRLETAAARLLTNRTIPITEVALSCGFASPASFSNSFKKHFGLSPTGFRREKSESPSNSNLNKVVRNPVKEIKSVPFHTEYSKGVQIWRAIRLLQLHSRTIGLPEGLELDIQGVVALQRVSA